MILNASNLKTKYFLNLSKLSITSGSVLPTSLLSFAITDFFDQKYSYNFSKYK